MEPPTTILIVDDDPRSRELLVTVLNDDGYRLLQADSGVQALEIAASPPPPDIIIMDVMMPVMDGFETCRKIRGEPSLQSIPVILVTALDNRRARLEGLKAGADELITKPFDPSELRIRLRTLAELNRFRKLLDERTRFQHAVEHGPDGVIITNADGHISMSNRAASRLFKGDITTGSNIAALLPKETIEQVSASLVSERPLHIPSIESRLRSPTDPETVVEVAATRLPQGAIYYSLHDVTARKSLENQLSRTQRLDVLGQLAGGMAHDLNNLLSSIITAAGWITHDGQADPRTVERAAGIIQSNASRGAELLRKVLMFSREKETRYEPISPEPVVREVAHVASESFGSKIQLRIIVGDLATGQTTPLKILGNTSQLKQILMNLCVNARDAMPEGGELTLRMETRRPRAEEIVGSPSLVPVKTYFVISVSDNGPGIAANVRERLFEPFVTSKSEGEGTGLGLSIVARLIHLHSGAVQVGANPEGGATFYCLFPLHQP